MLENFNVVPITHVTDQECLRWILHDILEFQETLPYSTTI